MVLKALFSMAVGKSLVFKGGTSLSKGWSLIDRFSEDIDLAIDRKFFGFAKEIGKNQRDKLRRTSKRYVEETLAPSLSSVLNEFGLAGHFSIIVPATTESDKDPVELFVEYNSILPAINPYINKRVKLEISCRSMREPFQEIAMRSMIAEKYPNEFFAEAPFYVATVLPGRTFLEKIFLLHEEFNRPNGCTHLERLTRHLYDIEKMMDKPFAIEAMNDRHLYNDIVDHRSKFTAWSGLDYGTHQPSTISFVPPSEVEDSLRRDYTSMQQNFIYGDSLPYDMLIERIKELQQRFRELK